MRRIGRYLTIVIAITMVFLANTVSAVFHPTPLKENQNTEFSTNKNSTLNSNTSRSDLHSIPEEIKNQKSESSFLDFWKSGVSTSESSFKGVSGYSDFFSKDNDSMELVIGVNRALPNAYNNIINKVSNVRGKIVNTVSAQGEIFAIVADVPSSAAYSLMKDVETNNLAQYIEPNRKFQAQLVPNDQYWSFQWGPQIIEADLAWNTTIGDSSILVAVIDTGIDYNHPDLHDNYVPLGYNWVNDTSDPRDDNGHGTHCAGIIAAVLNNALGIAGLAQVKIMAEKALDAQGSGYEDDLANAIFDAVDQSAKILSNSWGGSIDSLLIHEAVQYAYNHGVLVIAAAGNNGNDVKFYPAAYDEVVAVTATDRYDASAVFTSFGDWVEVAAPGVDIYSTMPTYHVTLNDYGYSMNYDYMSGTSMACPHAAGVAALIWSQFPNVTRDWVRAQLRYTGDDLGDPGFDEYYGYGRINARKAVEQAPPEHDLLIFDWNRPQYVKLGELATFNITVLNFGVSNETNVEVHLLVNDSLVDSTSISPLPGGTSMTVSLSWTPTTVGTHNVTYYVVPVPDETIIQNNQIAEILYVITPPPETNWMLLATDLDEGMGTNLKSIYGQVYSDIIYFKVEYYRLWTTINDIDTAIFIDADQNASTGLPDGTYSGQDTGIGADYVIVVGWEATEMWRWDPVAGMWDISNPISLAYLEAPENSNAFVVGVFFANVETAGIIDCAVVDIPSNWDWMPDSGYFTWILIRYEHELAVLLETPQYLQPGESSLLNATVCNRGLNNETNVEIQLLINGTEFASETLDELVNGTCHTINYSWTPTAEGIYNITAYAPPVPSENFTINNINTKFVSVHYPLINPEPRQYANYVMNYYDSSGHLIGQQGYLNLTYEYYVEPCKIYITAWQKDPSGYIYTGWMIVNTMNRFVESGFWAGLWYPGWIETDINIGSTINLMDGTATVNGTRMLVVGPRAIDCWEIPYSMYGYPYTFWYDKASGLWIKMDSTNPSTGERMELLLTDTNVPTGTQYEHDLGVTLDSPLRLQPGETSMLNATVYNLGLNNETSVEIYLLINDTQVASEPLSELVNGTSHALSYLWTPTVEGTYNITAYAPPVFGEEITANNQRGRLVEVCKMVIAVVLDSWGTDYGYDAFWDYLNTNWATYGNMRVMIDYTSLNKENITLADIEATHADVLIISDAWDYGYGWEFTDSEVEAIETYVLSGHGIIATSGTFNTRDGMASNNRKLADLFGMDPNIEYVWGTWTSGTFDLLTPRHDELWRNILDPYLSDSILTIYPYPSSDWSVQGVTTGWIEALSTDHYAAVITSESISHRAVYFTGMLESYGQYNENNRQLFYNAIVWAVPRITISISPSAGPVGTNVTVTGVKATANGTVEIYWDETFIENTTADEYGNFTYLLTIPPSSAGLHEIKAVDVATGETSSETFRVIFIILNPASGPAGTKVTVKGSGFSPENQTTVTFNDMLIGYAKVDSSGNFTFTFNIPLSTAETQVIKALDAEANYAFATFTVVDVTPLDITVDVGAIHFLGEVAEFYAQVNFKGVAVNATSMNAILYKPNGATESLSAQLIATGLYKIPYTILGNETGTYTLVITVSYVSDIVESNGTSFKCFLVSSTLALMNNRVIEIKDGLALVQKDLGFVKLNLTAMNVTLQSIFLKVISINGTTATIQTIIGVMNGTITRIDNNTATIVTPIGNIEADISSLKGAQETWIIPQYAIIIIALIAAVSSTLTLFFVRRRKTIEVK